MCTDKEEPMYAVTGLLVDTSVEIYIYTNQVVHPPQALSDSWNITQVMRQHGHGIVILFQIELLMSETSLLACVIYYLQTNFHKTFHFTDFGMLPVAGAITLLYSSKYLIIYTCIIMMVHCWKIKPQKNSAVIGTGQANHN